MKSLESRRWCKSMFSTKWMGLICNYKKQK